MVGIVPRLFGWMFVTLGVCGIVFPFLPSAKGEADDTSPVLIVVCLGLVGLGVFLIRRKA